MLKKVLLFSVCIILFNSACKKGSTPSPPPKKDEAADKINAILMLGNGTWAFKTDVISFFDKDNNLLYKLSTDAKGYYIFSSEQTDPNGNTTVEYEEILNHPETLYDSAYTVSLENGKQYITFIGDETLKFEFTTLTNTDVTISTDNVQPLSFVQNNKTVVADHATNVETWTKVN